MRETYVTFKQTHLQHTYKKTNETFEAYTCNIRVQHVKYPDLLLQLLDETHTTSR
jgi:hypothetical protein